MIRRFYDKEDYIKDCRSRAWDFVIDQIKFDPEFFISDCYDGVADLSDKQWEDVIAMTREWASCIWSNDLVSAQIIAGEHHNEMYAYFCNLVELKTDDMYFFREYIYE